MIGRDPQSFLVLLEKFTYLLIRQPRYLLTNQQICFCIISKLLSLMKVQTTGYLYLTPPTTVVIPFLFFNGLLDVNWAWDVLNSFESRKRDTSSWSTWAISAIDLPLPKLKLSRPVQTFLQSLQKLFLPLRYFLHKIDRRWKHSGKKWYDFGSKC